MPALSGASQKCLLAIGLAALWGCQSRPTGELDRLVQSQWQAVYSGCMTESAHRNPSLTLYLDMHQVAQSCRALANQRVRRF